MEFRILGPLEVVEDGRALGLGGMRQRALLALLLTRANAVVSTDVLVDGLWGSAPPRAAANTLQYYVSQLRKLLGADRILTQPPGYMMRVEPGETDLQRFEELTRAGDAESLREALALWRGAPLADLAYEQFAQVEIARLEELRATALEKRIDADLELGRHAELIGELEGLALAHPFRERFRAQLMLALYRAGRQVEALAVYRDARSTLVEELGIEPGAALQELERAILRQDPTLEPPTRAAEPARRSILVVPSRIDGAETLLRLAEPLAHAPQRELIVAALLSPGQDPADATAALAELRARLGGRGVETRIAAYGSAARGDEAVRLAHEQDVDLVLADAPPRLLEHGTLDGDLTSLLGGAACDVAILVGGERLDPASGRPVVVPFGGVDHDWSAVEIAAWLARSLGVALRMAGVEEPTAARDASRALARASLALQAVVGIVAEPRLVPPGSDGLLAAAADASTIVIGLSDRWRMEGIGETRLEVAARAAAPTLLVRRGLRPGGLAPPGTMTRFTWTFAEATLGDG